MQEITARFDVLKRELRTPFNVLKHELTPLQEAVITDDLETVELILRPDSTSARLIQSLIRHSPIRRGPTPEELHDQITQPIKSIIPPRFNRPSRYSTQDADHNTLLHLAASKCSFRILKRRRMPNAIGQPFGDFWDLDNFDQRNLEECSLYHPYNKAAILKLLLDYLPAEKIIGTINKPGLHAMTPLHYAIISALAFTQNGYNAPLLEEHQKTIALLMSRTASPDRMSWGLEAPGVFAQPSVMKKFFLGTDGQHNFKGGYPLPILQLYRDLAFWESPGVPKIDEDYDCEIDENVREQISQTIKRVRERNYSHWQLPDSLYDDSWTRK